MAEQFPPNVIADNDASPEAVPHEHDSRSGDLNPVEAPER